jgi:ankyrin repeat protein
MRFARRLSFGCKVPAILILSIATCLLAAPAARAHETDQFTVPPGREFADVGPILNRWFYDAIVRGMNKTNADIKSAIESQASESSIRDLQSNEHLAHAVNKAFPWAMDVIEGWDNDLVSQAMEARFPGFVTAYKQPITNIYQHTHMIFDPRQFFRIWLGRTLNCYGHYMGTDKIGHFTDNGMNLYNAYEKARGGGASEDEANRKALWLSTDDPLLGEKGMVGYGSAGDYSNGDLASNYIGYLFYRNLYEPMKLTGAVRPPMCVRDGPYWKLAAHVQPDNDFMAVYFADDHLDEALNPGHFESGMRKALRKAVQERREYVLEHYHDEHGCRRTRAWFDRKLDEMRTYYGVNYGYYGPHDQLVSIPNTLFAPPSETGDANAANQYGETPLHIAAAEGDAAAVQRLLARRANPNATLRTNESRNADWGSTPLHYAAAVGSAECVRLLLGAGANARAANDLGVTPLHRAVRYPQVAAILLDRGADPRAQDARGRTPLHWTANDDENCRGVAAMLLDRGADPKLADHEGRTPLHLGAACGRTEVASELLRRGADANAPDGFRETALHLAAGNRHAGETVRTLVASGANVNAADDFGCTALHDAARAGASDAVAILLRSGAAPAVADAYGVTPGRLAQQYSHPVVLALLPAPPAAEGAPRAATFRDPTRRQ